MVMTFAFFPSKWSCSSVALQF